MKKTITLLALAFCLNGWAQSNYNAFLTYNTVDDFFDEKPVNHGNFIQLNGNAHFKYDSLGKTIKYNLKKHNIFAYSYWGNYYITNGGYIGSSFFGGNKKYFATWNLGGSTNYEQVGDARFFESGSVQTGSSIYIDYYKASDIKKRLTLEELVQDCPEVYNKYMASKKEKGHKNDKNSAEYIWDQLNFFKMYIACIK